MKIVCVIQFFKEGKPYFIGPFGDGSSKNDLQDKKSAKEFIKNKSVSNASVVMVRDTTEMIKPGEFVM